MPEQWMRDLMGEEERPRPGFGDELAAELERGWHSPGAGRPWVKVFAVTAAVALVIAGVAVLTSPDDTTAPADTTPTVTTSTPTAPSSSPGTTPVASTLTPTTVPATTDPALPDGPAQPIKEYAVALADGEYLTAAKLLGEGGLEWTARADLRPLYRPEFGLRPEDGSNEGLAAALERWCIRAACAGSIESINDIGDGWFSVAVTGQGNFSLYRVSTFEGQPSVRGLPLQRRTDTPNADTDSTSTLCPTDRPIDRTAWADVDGDGWLELLVAQVVGEPVSDESGVRNHRVVVCGTSTIVAPLEITGDSLLINAVNPTGNGADTLLIGFTEGYYSGDVYRYDPSGSLAVVVGDGEPVRFGFAPLPAGPPGTSVGCDSIWPGDGVSRLFRLEYTVDGVTIAYAASDLVTGEPLGEGTVPVESEQGVSMVNGTCNGLPVVAY